MRKYFDAIGQIAGNVVSVRAGGVGYDELAMISTARGDSLAQVIRLEGDEVSLQVFAGSQGISNRDRIRFLHRPMQVPFSEGLLGRVFDGSGRARDGRGAVFGKMLDIRSPVVNPVRRRMPDQMIQTTNAPRMAPLLLPLPPRMSIIQMIKVPNMGLKTPG